MVYYATPWYTMVYHDMTAMCYDTVVLWYSVTTANDLYSGVEAV